MGHMSGPAHFTLPNMIHALWAPNAMSLQIASTAHLALEFKLLKHFFTSLHFQIQNNRQYLFHDLQERLVHPNKNWLPGSQQGVTEVLGGLPCGQELQWMSSAQTPLFPSGKSQQSFILTSNATLTPGNNRLCILQALLQCILFCNLHIYNL